MTRHRTVRIALIALALATAAPLALAQEDPVESREQDDAETAFLRAYYLELGEKDHAAALDAYRGVMSEHAGTDVAAKARLRMAYCFVALGRLEEARSALATLLEQPGDDAERRAEALRLLDEIGQRRGDDELTSLVLRALREDAWLSKTPEFGAPAVPVLTQLLRSADPEIVARSSASLRRIGSDAALDALVVALNADDIRYRDQLLESGLGAGPLPERVGRAIPDVADMEMRRDLIRSALLSKSPQQWLVDLVREHEWAREAAFRDERKAWDGLGWLTEAVVAAGPGPARDAAVAYMRLFERSQSKRFWTFKGAEALAEPSDAFLKDAQAVDVLVRHVLCDYQGRPSVALRDAVLAIPANRGIAMEWTWRHKMPCTRRDLLVDALAEDWHFDVSRRPTSLLAEVLVPSFDPPPTREEWGRILPTCEADVWDLIRSFAKDDVLPTDTLDALLDAGKAAHVLAWCEQSGVKDVEWAARAIPPLLRSENQNVAVSAAWLLGSLHHAERLDATPHVPDLIALFPVDRFWSRGGQTLSWMLTKMGETGRRAVVEAVPIGLRANDFILEKTREFELPETAEVARRIILMDLAEDDAQRTQLVGNAVVVLLQVAGDEALPTLLEAVRLAPPPRQRTVAAHVWNNSRLLSSAALESFVSPLVDDRPEEVMFPRHSGGLDAEAVRRLALRAIESDDPHVQVWGAQRQKDVRDPAAAGRLGELAESPDSAVRGSARAALTAMRKADEDMAWMRAVAARRATRARVDALLVSEDATERMAGVGGLVALRAPDAIDRLLDVAVSDPHTGVRIEARRALIAIGGRDPGGGK